MKKTLILITLLAFNLKLNTMQVSSSTSTTGININDLPQEVRLHILFFIKTDSLIQLFKEIARVAVTNTEMRNLAHDPVLIKNLIYRYFQEQLKTKSLENIAPEIGQAMEFIYNQFRKNRDTTLLQAIDTAFKSAIQDLSIKYLNSIGIDTENLNQKLLKAVQFHYLNRTILLLAANADPNIQDKYGNTALIEASEEGYTDIVNGLLAANAKPNVQDSLGNTALIIASRNGHIDIVNVLLAANANPNIKNNNGNTALIIASRNGNIDIVNALLAANADPNIKNNCGYTALITASEMGRFDIVKVLLSNIKTNPNIQNNDGKTALSIAEKKGLNDIANFIRNYASSYSNI